MGPERYIVLDLIRTIALILLLVTHVGQVIENPIGGFFGIQGFCYVSLGGIAVTLFLLVSGIALELRYHSKKVSYRQFFLQRLLRIYPIYYVALFVGVAFFALRLFTGTDCVRSLLPTLDSSDLILAATGFYAFAGEWGGPFIGSSWFVGLIVALYAGYPFLSRAIARSPHVAILILLAISVASRLLVGQYEVLPSRALDWFPLCRLFEFALGIYLVHVLHPAAWLCFNSFRRTGAPLKFVGTLSFPLFLIHHPLTLIVPYLIVRGFNELFAIFVFLSVSVLLSWIALWIDRHIPKDHFFLTEISHRGHEVNANRLEPRPHV